MARVKVWLDGEILTASDLNAEFDNALASSLTPDTLDDVSGNLVEMQAVADPYPAGAASLATTMRGEIQRLRYLVKQITGEDQWYYDPDKSIKTITEDLASVEEDLASVEEDLGKTELVKNLKPVVNATVNKLDIFTKSGGAVPDASNVLSVAIPDGNGYTFRNRSAAYLSGTSQIVMADAANYWSKGSLDAALKSAYIYAIWDGTGIIWALGGLSSLRNVSTTTTTTDLDFLLLEANSTYTRNAAHFCISCGQISYEYNTAETPNHTIQATTYVQWGADPCDALLQMIVVDQKAQNTAGGTFTAGAWRTRDLNTILKNNIPGASVASNQITLPSGSYNVFATCPAYVVDLHQPRLQNITAGTTLLTGMSGYARASDNVSNMVTLMGSFTLTAATVIEIQHYCGTTRSTDGFGVPANFGAEIYTQIIITKSGV